MEDNTYKDDFLKNIIKLSTEDTKLSDDFVDRVVCCCCEYERVKEAKILRVKKWTLALLPLILIAVVIFVPGVSAFLLTLLSKITLVGVLKYYAVASAVTIISFYLLLTERVVKFVKMKLISIN